MSVFMKKYLDTITTQKDLPAITETQKQNSSTDHITVGLS